MSKARVFALAALAFLVLANASKGVEPKYLQERPPTYHAFIFGNDAYEALPEIKSAARDFEKMREYFANAKYRIWDMDGAGKFKSVDQFYKYMKDALTQIQPGDVVVLYYSGHGFHYGNQDWLVPLDYPAGTVDQQLLFKHAVGVDDVIAGLAKRRIDYAVAIIDACRTQPPFQFRTPGGTFLNGEPRLPAFSYTGPSLTAWSIGVPTYAGGTAIGTDSPDEMSVYSGIFLEALRKKPRISELQPELAVAVLRLASEGRIAPNEIAPRFFSSRDFTFDASPDPTLVAGQKQEWLTAITEPSRSIVSAFMVRNPGSAFSSAGWKYIDDHAGEPEDAGGSSLTSADAIDYAFHEAQLTGKMVAIATSGFDVNFPRNTIGLPAVDRDLLQNAIAYVDKPGEIGDAYTARYEAKGSKQNFDIDIIGAAGALAVNTGQTSRPVPDVTALPTFTFGRSSSIQINRTFFDDNSGKLYAEIAPGQEAVGPPSSSVWTDFNYRGGKQPSFNNLNRALREVIIDGPQLADHSIAKITEDVRRSSKDILWVSIAVEYRPPDLSEYQNRKAKAETDQAAAAIDRELDNTVRTDRLALAEARLRAQDARIQLIDAGIDGKRITTVGVDAGQSLGNRVRLRFFGSR
nr:caspase family protein [Rhizobium leguminosarum]